ncbi:MAG: hypothetical protein A2857_00530 [Candidatus Levybacteria bacterium RIFCSPHIGHO2_01_FULL_36_15]|nr:MAG: hypothetical protein A2857_00530 [Candidatus Levybacteria bacterium RIFCSPHIGHO2_01_FULL_36_15]OGH38857.1 MAG: hypothetical protein A2905_05460 [Candidatus Levybacteria bacterium RIFCSPLOWO2_01_FULL_36_10]
MKERLVNAKQVRSILKQIDGAPKSLYEVSPNQVFNISLRLKDQIKEAGPLAFLDSVSETAHQDARRLASKANKVQQRVDQIMQDNQDKIASLDEKEKEDLGRVTFDVLQIQNRAKAGLLSYFVRKGFVNYANHLRQDGSIDVEKLQQSEAFQNNDKMRAKLQSLEEYKLSEGKLKKLKKEKTVLEDRQTSSVDVSAQTDGFSNEDSQPGNSEVMEDLVNQSSEDEQVEDFAWPGETDDFSNVPRKIPEVIVYQSDKNRRGDTEDEGFVFGDREERTEKGVKVKRVKGVLLDANGEEVFESDKPEVKAKKRKDRAAVAGVVMTAVGCATGTIFLCKQVTSHFASGSVPVAAGESRNIESIVPPSDFQLVPDKKAYPTPTTEGSSINNSMSRTDSVPVSSDKTVEVISPKSIPQTGNIPNDSMVKAGIIGLGTLLVGIGKRLRRKG